jgi:hypothetical protein
MSHAEIKRILHGMLVEYTRAYQSMLAKSTLYTECEGLRAEIGEG